MSYNRSEIDSLLLKQRKIRRKRSKQRSKRKLKETYEPEEGRRRKSDLQQQQMNREELDITHIKEEQRGMIPAYQDMLDPLEDPEYEDISEDIAKEIPRRFREDEILKEAEQHLDFAPGEELENMGFFESLHFYLELIGKQVSIEGIKVFKAGDDPCSAFLALHKIFTTQDPELAEAVRFCHKHGVGKRTLQLLIEGIEPDDYRSLFYGFLILADLSYPIPKNLKNYDQHVQWGQQLKATLVGRPQFAKLATRLLGTSMSMQESASEKDRKKFKKLLEIVIVTVNNILAISQDGILQMDMIYNTQLSTKQKAIEVHQRFVVQLAEQDYFDLLSACMFDFSHGTLSFTGYNSIAITFMETFYYLYSNIDLHHVFKSVKYVDPDDPLRKLEIQPKKRAKLPNLIEMMEESSRHPRFLRMPMFKIPQQDGRYIMTNTLDPEKQREEKERGFKQRKKTKITRSNPSANNPSPIKYAADQYLNCYTQDFYRHLLKIAETLTTQSSMFNDLVDISFSELERNDTAVISKFNRYQFFIFITFILKYNRFKHLTSNAILRDEMRARLQHDPEYIGRITKMEDEIERQIPFHLPVNDVKNALNHDILDLAIEGALSESKVTKAKERKVYEYHASMAYLLEVLNYIDEVDKVKIEDSEIRIFKEMRDRQNQSKREMYEEMQRMEKDEGEMCLELEGKAEGIKTEEQKELQELQVVLTPDQIFKLEAYFVSERMKKHLLHRELLSVARFGLENWKSKDGVQLRRDLIGFVDSLTSIMERYTHNKMFRVMTTKKKKKKKRKLSMGLDADDQEQAALLFKIEQEERARMEAQNPQREDEQNFLQEVLENKLNGYQEEKESQQNKINENAYARYEESEESEQQNYMERQTSFKIEFATLITDKVLAQYVDVLKHTTVKHLREQKNLLREVARFFIMISDTLNKPEVFFQADIIIAFFSLLKNKNFSTAFPGVKEIKRAIEIIVRQFVTMFRKNPLIAVEGLFRYQNHDLHESALCNYETENYGNAQEQFKTKQDAQLEQHFEAAYSDDQEEEYNRPVREAAPPSSSEESDIDGELVYDLAKMNELWTEAEDLVLRAEFHKLKGNTKQRCQELERMLKEAETENIMVKSAKDIKMRLNMLNLKRNKQKPMKRERKAKPAYQGQLPQRKVNQLERVEDIKVNIGKLYALAQQEEEKGELIEEGLTLVKENLSNCSYLRRVAMMMKEATGKTKDSSSQDYCFFALNQAQEKCFKIEIFRDLLRSLCILSPQEYSQTKKGKWMMRIPGSVGVGDLIEIQDKFDEALQSLNDSLSSS